MQLPVDRMIVVKESKFSALEDCLWHQDEPETPRLSLMVLDQADRKRPLPQWLGFHDLCKGSSGVRDKCQINRKIALDPRTLIALVAGVQGGPMEEGSNYLGDTCRTLHIERTS